ncbi:MAG TPA: phosphatidate cytidylyltransferase, partial [Candidatus Goldiibacteriota bacterium]|nr:phosphatidate cytidylyltransferase [Candidatus Goldiibacteriota bacterium]
MVKRIIISLIILPVFVFLIFYKNPYFFVGLNIIALTMALNELYVMLDKKGDKNFRLTGLAISFVILALITMQMEKSYIFFASALFIMGLFFMVILKKDTAELPRVFNTLGPVFYITVLGSFGILLRFIEPGGSWWVFLLGLLTLTYDGGAYFVGSAIGKHKLIPELSPGKTIEGCIGGIVINVIVAAIISYTVLPKGFIALHHVMILALLLSVTGQIG